MKQRSLRPGKRNAKPAAPKDLSDIGVDRVHYDPTEDFFVVPQDNLSGVKPRSGKRKRKPGIKVRGRGLLGGFLMLGLAAGVGVPALSLSSVSSADTSAVVVPDADTAADEANAARLADIARQQEEASRVAAEETAAREAAAAAEQSQMLDGPAGSDASYGNCTDVWDTLGRAILTADPGYSTKLDRDGDGIGCESRPSR